MNVHGALDNRVGRAGVHHINDAVNRLVASRSQNRSSENSFAFGVDEHFHEAVAIALLHSATHLGHRPGSDKSRLARFADLAFGHADASKRWVHVERVGGDAVGDAAGIVVEQVRGAARASNVPFLRGVFLGMLAELRDLPVSDLTKELRFLAQAPVEIMTTAGDFLDGILAVSRTSLLVNADDLVAALDDLLGAADWDPFLVMLPRLRAAFEEIDATRLPKTPARSLSVRRASVGPPPP